MPNANRRTVLKRIGASTLGAVAFSGLASAAECNATQATEPDSGDFGVYVHYDPDAWAGQNGRPDELVDYIESEFGSVSLDFDVTAIKYQELDAETVDQYDGLYVANEVLAKFGDYIQTELYGGDWSGSQGYLDLYLFDDDYWGGTGGGSITSGAYDGAGPDDQNPWPALVVNGYENGSYKDRAIHELVHTFFYLKTDEYGYNQKDHAVMDLQSGNALHEDSADFINNAYSNNRVYTSAPCDVYNCHPWC